MAKMTKSEMLEHLAKKTNLPRKVVGQVVDELVQLAYKEAHNQFTIPGLGIVVLVQRPARKMIMRFGPKTGQEIDVPAKHVLKFRFAKAAKEAILGGGEKKDDLVIIEGIGPKIAKALIKADIKTFKQLAGTPVSKLHDVLHQAKLAADPATWPEQAGLLAAGKMEEFNKLTAELKGGRRV
jgi:DNA-binding protein HU-beta